MATSSKSKSTNGAAAPTAAPTAADVLAATAPAPGAETLTVRTRKANPFQPLIAAMGGESATDEDFAAMAAMLESANSGTPYYPSDSQVLAAGMYFIRRFYGNLSGLVDRVTEQIAIEKGTPLNEVRQQMINFLGIQPAARWNSQDGADNTTYRKYPLDTIATASGLVWEHYGEEGLTMPGLIRRSQKRQQPSS